MKEILFRAATDPNTGIFFWAGIILGMIAATAIIVLAEIDMWFDNCHLSDIEEVMREEEEGSSK